MERTNRTTDEFRSSTVNNRRLKPASPKVNLLATCRLGPGWDWMVGFLTVLPLMHTPAPLADRLSPSRHRAEETPDPGSQIPVGSTWGHSYFRVSIVSINTMKLQRQGFTSPSSLQSVMAGCQGRTSKAGTWRWAASWLVLHG